MRGKERSNSVRVPPRQRTVRWAAVRCDRRKQSLLPEECAAALCDLDPWWWAPSRLYADRSREREFSFFLLRSACVGVVVPAVRVRLLQRRDRASVSPTRFRVLVPRVCFRAQRHDIDARLVRLRSEFVPLPDATERELHRGPLRVAVWRTVLLQEPPASGLQAPAGEAGDFLTAYGTTSVLVMPEKAKNFRTPKCISHMGPFAICEVGFIRGIIRVGFASDFNVSCDGCTRGR